MEHSKKLMGGPIPGNFNESWSTAVHRPREEDAAKYIEHYLLIFYEDETDPI